jgi:hypothetical protein
VRVHRFVASVRVAQGARLREAKYLKEVVRSVIVLSRWSFDLYGLRHVSYMAKQTKEAAIKKTNPAAHYAVHFSRAFGFYQHSP